MRVVKWLFFLLIIPALLIAGYIFFVLNWSFSEGERAGWVQKLSKKGWVCKTWEGELSLISMPGAGQEKFFFTVHDDKVAEQINRVMGKRVTLHYEEKVGLPTSCFGETRHFVTKVAAVDEIPLSPGVVVPVPQTPSVQPPAVPAPVQGAPAAAPAAPAMQTPAAVPVPPAPASPAPATSK
ncbi:MAG: hypothetical protein RL341_2440 [Pseudomonadota bacterium]|jgi:hypothetical protein